MKVLYEKDNYMIVHKSTVNLGLIYVHKRFLVVKEHKSCFFFKSLSLIDQFNSFEKAKKSIDLLINNNTLHTKK